MKVHKDLRECPANQGIQDSMVVLETPGFLALKVGGERKEERELLESQDEQVNTDCYYILRIIDIC